MSRCVCFGCCWLASLYQLKCQDIGSPVKSCFFLFLFFLTLASLREVPGVTLNASLSYTHTHRHRRPCLRWRPSPPPSGFTGVENSRFPAPRLLHCEGGFTATGRVWFGRRSKLLNYCLIVTSSRDLSYHLFFFYVHFFF